VFQLMTGPLFAQEESLVLKKYDLQSELEDPQLAKKEIINKAYLQATEEVIEDVFSLQNLNLSKQKIEQNLLKYSAKYIPYLKTTTLVKKDIATSTASSPTSSYSMSVEVRLSINQLRQLLKQSGLIQNEEIQKSIIAFLRFEDRVSGDSSNWWEGGVPPVFLKKVSNQFEKSLRSGLMKSGFFLFPFATNSFFKSLPPQMIKPRFEPEELVRWGKLLKSGIVVDGYVYILKDENKNEHRIEIKMTALETTTAKVIAEVSRRYLTGRGDYQILVENKLKNVLETLTQDLVSQIQSSLEQGTLGYEQTVLVFNGSWRIKDHEVLKNQIKDQVALIRSVKERLISNQEIVFEVTSPIAAQKLSEKLTPPYLKDRRSKVDAVSENKIIFRLE
ncbi:MAG TPA: hypothetical protein PLJ21_04960, partial [Pseudobdellovibrionaceae bacterium]|nr:hypothetical protein [Pseudobdellovibrionaceae bacterium]